MYVIVTTGKLEFHVNLVLACIPKISGNFESFSVSDKKLLSLISSKCSMLHSCACAYRYAESSYIRCTIQACNTPVYIIMFSSVSVDIDNRNKKLFKMMFLFYFIFLCFYLVAEAGKSILYSM